MGLISKIFSATAGEVADKVAGIADRFMQTPDEKAGFRLQVEQLLQQRDSEVEQTIRDTVNARMQVTVAELHQGDNYTKRARPTVVYFGLLVIFYNYCLIPTVQLIHGADLQPFALPSEFWMAWGGVVATWSIGRDANRVIPRSRIAANLAGTRAEPAEGYL